MELTPNESGPGGAQYHQTTRLSDGERLGGRYILNPLQCLDMSQSSSPVQLEPLNFDTISSTKNASNPFRPEPLAALSIWNLDSLGQLGDSHRDRY